MNELRLRRAGALLAVALLLVTAGCSALGGPNGGTANATETAGAPATSSPMTNTTPKAGDSNATGTSSTSHSHSDHTHGGSSSGSDTAATTGRMAVVIDGQRINLSAAIEGSEQFRMDSSRPDTWHTNGTPTLATVLSKANIDASASSLTYGSATYKEQQQGTKLIYRVNGQPVKPSEYTLQEGDEIWVTVLTERTDGSTPGNYLKPDRLHAHGSIKFVVNGKSLNFTREKWQAASHNSYFHFEGGHADPWHAHSWSVTLGYALSTLEDINVSDQGVTYNGTTYSSEQSGTTVTVEVNGEPVDPTSYYLKDGDSVRIIIESNS